MNSDTTSLDHVQYTSSFADLAAETLRSLVHDISFREYVMKVKAGLKANPNSGEYRYARQQVLRLWAPVTGVTAPLFCMAVILLVPKTPETQWKEVPFEYVDSTTKVIPPELVKIEPKQVIEQTSLQSETPAQYMQQTLTATSSSGDREPDEGIQGLLVQVPYIRDPVAFAPSLLKTRTTYTKRGKKGRRDALNQHQAPASGITEDAVMKALRWLKKTQSSDGSWPQTKPAMTSFALLTFLAHDEKTDSVEFGDTVRSAIQFMESAQEADGHFAGRDGHDYTHPIATYALCEAYGMMRLPHIKETARKALACIVQGQHGNGGFNYNLNAENRDDTSYMAWCAQAMKAGEIAYVMDEPEKLRTAMRKAIDGFRKNCRDDGDGAYVQGGFGYTSPDISGLTSAGTLCAQLLGAPRKDVAASIETIKGWTFEWNSATHGSTLYYAYYTTQVKFHEGGPQWTAWNKQFAPAVANNQTVVRKAIEDEGGNLVDIGYWDSTASGHSDGGEGRRVMTTCLCTLMLEVYYRYLPSYDTLLDVRADASAAGDSGKNPHEVRIDIDGG